jgi:hypothetical protein
LVISAWKLSTPAAADGCVGAAAGGCVGAAAGGFVGDGAWVGAGVGFAHPTNMDITISITLMTMNLLFMLFLLRNLIKLSKRFLIFYFDVLR